MAIGEVDFLDDAELFDFYEANGRTWNVGRHNAFDAGDVFVDLDNFFFSADGFV